MQTDFLLRGLLMLAFGLMGSVLIVHGGLLIRSRGRIGLLKSDMRTIRSELTVWAPTTESLTEAEQFEVERRFMQLLGWSYVGMGLPFTTLGVIGFFVPWTPDDLIMGGALMVGLVVVASAMGVGSAVGIAVGGARLRRSQDLHDIGGNEQRRRPRDYRSAWLGWMPLVFAGLSAALIYVAKCLYGGHMTGWLPPTSFIVPVAVCTVAIPLCAEVAQWLIARAKAPQMSEDPEIARGLDNYFRAYTMGKALAASVMSCYVLLQGASSMFIDEANVRPPLSSWTHFMPMYLIFAGVGVFIYGIIISSLHGQLGGLRSPRQAPSAARPSLASPQE